MITRSEVAATQQVVDDIAPVNATTSIAFVLGPDDVKVELLENKQQPVPITLHHVHFFGQQNAEMRAWYAKVFGAKPRDAAQLPRRGSAGRRAELLPVADASRRHDRARGRSHRLRGEEPRGVLQEARGDGHQAQRALSQRAGARPRRSRSSPIRGARRSS